MGRTSAQRRSVYCTKKGDLTKNSVSLWYQLVKIKNTITFWKKKIAGDKKSISMDELQNIEYWYPVFLNSQQGDCLRSFRESRKHTST